MRMVIFLLSLFCVDDILVTGSSMKKINGLEKKLEGKFSMKDLEEAKQLLGMKIFEIGKRKNCGYLRRGM